MRTDIRTDRQQVKCPNATSLGFGKWKAQTGDLIHYKVHYADGSHGYATGRVIGRIAYAPAIADDPKPIKNHIIVLQIDDCFGHCFERWIDPLNVTAIYSLNSDEIINGRHAQHIKKLMAFFLSDSLPTFDIDTLRLWAASGYQSVEKFQQASKP